MASLAPARILVADDDPWIQRMMATILSRRGHVVSVAGDGERALAAALEVGPELVVTATALHGRNGRPWIEKLRGRSEFSSVPIVFLTGGGHDGPARIRGFELGVDEYLPKPFRIDELDSLVARTLARAREQAARVPPVHRAAAPLPPPPRRRAAVRGQLEEIGLSNLLTVFEMERKTGVLTLDRVGVHAQLFLRHGHIVRARVDGPIRFAGESAVYHVLAWADGEFEFVVTDVQGPDEIQSSTTGLVMEGARRLDEHNRKAGL